jgi:[histone H3]-dimethyl-L-lysine9 demethylase
MCRLCGREACGECYERIKEVTYAPKDAPAAHQAQLTQRREQLGNTCISLLCSRKREHSSNDFTAMTRFEKQELDDAITAMKKLVGQDEVDMEQLVEPVIKSFVSLIPPGSSSVTLDPNRCHSTPLFHVDELEQDAFRYLWARGSPVVVHGLLSKMEGMWTPDFFVEKYGNQECSVVDCQSDASKKTTVGKFFSTFGKYNGRKEVWKLKVICLLRGDDYHSLSSVGLAFDS